MKHPDDYPNFNFNASHCRDYVGIACELSCIVGLDIVSLSIVEHGNLLEFIENFRAYFTNLEWRSISSAGTLDEVLLEFYRYWCLKEACVKAIGAGLGYGLDRIEFRHMWSSISIYIDGSELKDWRFSIFDLDRKHCASVARGPPSTAVNNYSKTLGKKLDPRSWG